MDQLLSQISRGNERKGKELVSLIGNAEIALLISTCSYKLFESTSLRCFEISVFIRGYDNDCEMKNNNSCSFIMFQVDLNVYSLASTCLCLSQART